MPANTLIPVLQRLYQRRHSLLVSDFTQTQRSTTADTPIVVFEFLNKMRRSVEIHTLTLILTPIGVMKARFVDLP